MRYLKNVISLSLIALFCCGQSYASTDTLQDAQNCSAGVCVAVHGDGTFVREVAVWYRWKTSQCSPTYSATYTFTDKHGPGRSRSQPTCRNNAVVWTPNTHFKNGSNVCARITHRTGNPCVGITRAGYVPLNS